MGTEIIDLTMSDMEIEDEKTDLNDDKPVKMKIGETWSQQHSDVEEGDVLVPEQSVLLASHHVLVTEPDSNEEYILSDINFENEDSAQEIVDNRKSKHICPDCGSSWQTVGYLRRHMRDHYGPNKRSSNSKKKGIHDLTNVEQRVSNNSRSELSEIGPRNEFSVLEVEPESNEETGSDDGEGFRLESQSTKQTYACPVCDERFSSFTGQDFNEHMNKHRERTVTFKCKICVKEILELNYDSHMKSHSFIRPEGEVSLAEKNNAEIPVGMPANTYYEILVKDNIKIPVMTALFPTESNGKISSESKVTVPSKPKSKTRVKNGVKICAKTVQIPVASAFDIPSESAVANPVESDVEFPVEILRYLWKSRIPVESDETPTEIPVEFPVETVDIFPVEIKVEDPIKITDKFSTVEVNQDNPMETTVEIPVETEEIPIEVKVEILDEQETIEWNDSDDDEERFEHLHPRKKVPKKSYDFPLCHESFSEGTDLRCHSDRVHSEEEKLQCRFCDMKLSCLKSLTRHERLHTEAKSQSCAFCPKTFLQKYSLKRHEKVHTGRMPFKCNQCKREFTVQRSLVRHLRRTHHSSAPDQGTSQRECIEEIPRKRHSGEKPFSCSDCELKFATRGNLEKHVERNHSGEKLFSCIQCGEKFTNRYYLKRHEVTHEYGEELPFSCSGCGQKFRMPEYLKSHKKKHSGERPYSCGICERRFGWKQNLNKHELKVHFKSADQLHL